MRADSRQRSADRSETRTIHPERLRDALPRSAGRLYRDRDDIPDL
ncbi:hypothetical protein [Embleya sp. NPDC005575]